MRDPWSPGDSPGPHWSAQAQLAGFVNGFAPRRFAFLFAFAFASLSLASLNVSNLSVRVLLG